VAAPELLWRRHAKPAAAGRTAHGTERVHPVVAMQRRRSLALQTHSTNKHHRNRKTRIREQEPENAAAETS
jgi:hypothetical protein